MFALTGIPPNITYFTYDSIVLLISNQILKDYVELIKGEQLIIYRFLKYLETYSHKNMSKQGRSHHIYQKYKQSQLKLNQNSFRH